MLQIVGKVLAPLVEFRNIDDIVSSITQQNMILSQNGQLQPQLQIEWRKCQKDNFWYLDNARHSYIFFKHARKAYFVLKMLFTSMIFCGVNFLSANYKQKMGRYEISQKIWLVVHLQDNTNAQRYSTQMLPVLSSTMTLVCILSY